MPGDSMLSFVSSASTNARASHIVEVEQTDQALSEENPSSSGDSSSNSGSKSSKKTSSQRGSSKSSSKSGSSGSNSSTSAEEMAEKRKKLVENAIAVLRKKFGAEAITNLGDTDGQFRNVPVIPTGSIALDMALGIGGVPKVS